MPAALQFARFRTLAVAAAFGLVGSTAAAEQIVVSNYAQTTNGMPFAVAMEKGFFKEFGVDVTGILSSDGGGTTIRNLLGGRLAYGEAAVGAVASAVLGGADLRIISGNVHTVAEFAWLVMPNSPVKSLKDVKGKKLGYTNPRSTSQALQVLMLERQSMQSSDVELIRTGGFGAGLTALELGGIDVMVVADPLWTLNPGKFRIIAEATDVLPLLSNVVGVTTGEAARTKGDFIRGVIKARRKGVEYMVANVPESSRIIAKAYNLDPAVTEKVVSNLIASEKKGGIPYWGPGDLRLDTMDNMIRAQKLVGAFEGQADWSKLVDESFLPDDLKRKR
jgi:NitT/TauT family transport system substrate-binding protein